MSFWPLQLYFALDQWEPQTWHNDMSTRLMVIEWMSVKRINIRSEAYPFSTSAITAIVKPVTANMWIVHVQHCTFEEFKFRWNFENLWRVWEIEQSSKTWYTLDREGHLVVPATGSTEWGEAGQGDGCAGGDGGSESSRSLESLSKRASSLSITNIGWAFLTGGGDEEEERLH